MPSTAPAFAGVLLRDKTKPGREVTPAAEGPGGWRQCDQRRRDDRTNARDRHQPLRHRVCLRPGRDLAVEKSNLRLQCLQTLCDNDQYRPRFSRDA